MNLLKDGVISEKEGEGNALQVENYAASSEEFNLNISAKNAFGAGKPSIVPKK